MEFTDIMGQYKAVMDSEENIGLLKRGEHWLYSIDNDKIHKGADLEGVGFTEADIFYHPALSSDMHKVVENVHAWLDRKMQEWLEDKEDEKLKVEDCKEELSRLFDQVYQQEWIQANVNSLRDTYEAIVLADGGYPPAKRR